MSSSSSVVVDDDSKSIAAQMNGVAAVAAGSSSESTADTSSSLSSVAAQMNGVAAAAKAVGSNSGSTSGTSSFLSSIFKRRKQQRSQNDNGSFIISGSGGISTTANNDDTNNDDDDMDQQEEGRGKLNSMTKDNDNKTDRTTVHSVSNGKRYQALASSSSSSEDVQDLDQQEQHGQQIDPATSSITSITTAATSFKTAANTATTTATVAVMTNSNKKKATTTTKRTSFLSSRFPEKPRRYFDHMTDADIWERFCSKPLASSSSEDVKELDQQEQHGQQINPAATSITSITTPATSSKTAAADTAATTATVAVITNKENKTTTTPLQQRRQQACASQGFTGNWIYTGVPPPPPPQRFVEKPYVDVHMLNDRAKKEIQERFKMILEKRKFSTTPTTTSSSNNTPNAFSASTSAADYKLRARKDFQERLRMLRKKRKFSSTATSSSNNTHNAHNADTAATTTSSSSYSFNSRDLKRKKNPNNDSPTSVAASANATTSIKSDMAVASTAAAATSAGIAVPAAASTSSNSFYSFISRDLKKKTNPKNDSPTSVAASANATSIASNLAVAITTTATGIAVPAAATTTSNSFYSFNSRDLKKKTNPNHDSPTSVAASADATSTTSNMAVASTTTAATATGISVLADAAAAADAAVANAPLSTLKSTPSLSSSQPLVIDLLSSSSDNDDDSDDDDSSDDDDDRKPKANADAVVGSNCGKSVVKSPPRTLEDEDEDEAVRRSLDDIDIDEAVRRSLLDQQQPLRQQRYKHTSTTSSDESESNAESNAESEAESDAESEYVAKKVNNKNLNKFKQLLKDKENSNSKNLGSGTKCTDTANKVDTDADADADADIGGNIDVVVVGEESKRCDTVEQQQQKIITVATAIVASPKAANDDFPSSPSILEEEVKQPWKEFQHNLKKRRNEILNPTTTKQKRDRSTSNPTMVAAAAAAATSSVTIPTFTAIANTGTSSGNDHDRVAITAATTTAGNSSGKDVDRSNTPHDSDKEDEMVDTSGADDSPRPPAGEGIPNDDDADAGDDDDGVLKIPLKCLVIDEDAYFKPNFRRQPTAEYNSNTNIIVIRFTYFGVSYPLVCEIAINMDHVDEKGCWTVFNNNHITATTLFKNGFMFIRVAEDEIMNLHETMKKGGHRNIMLEFENSQHLIKLLKMCSIKGIGTEILPIQYTPSEVESAVGSYDKPFKNIIRDDDYLSKSIHCLLRHHYSKNKRKERVRENIQTKNGVDDGGTAATNEEPSPKKARIAGSITTDDDEALVDQFLLDVPTSDSKKEEDPTTTSPNTLTAVDQVFLSSNSIDDDDDDDQSKNAAGLATMMDSTIDDKGERKGVLPSADINTTSTTKSGVDKNKHESSLSISGNVAAGEGSDGNAICRGSGNDDDAAAAAAVDINIVNDPEEEETLLVVNEERTTGGSIGRCVEICAAAIRDVFSTIVDTVSDPCEERHQQIAKWSDDENQNEPDSKSYLPTNNNDDEAIPQELINENDDGNDNDHREDAQLDIGNSKKHIYLLTLPMIFLTGILLHTGLFAYIPTSVIVTKFVITLFRFIVMGLFLLPFGRLSVVENPMRIISYVVLLVAVASYEVSSRTKYTFDGQFYYIMGPIIFNVGWVLLLIFQGILGELRHVLPLPIVGMLAVSSIDSISSSLDIITTSLVENHVYELVPRFGNNATNYEAGNELFIHAIQESSMMPLNMIRDILIMGMLGMIGGRFFCGSRPIGTDVGCQMKIIFLIAVCTLSTILLNYVVMMELVLYSEQQVLCTDRFAKNHARSLIEVMVGAFADK